MLQIRSPRSILVLLRGASRVPTPDMQDDASVVLAECPFQSEADYSALVAVARGEFVSSSDVRRFYSCRAEFLEVVAAA